MKTLKSGINFGFWAWAAVGTFYLLHMLEKWVCRKILNEVPEVEKELYPDEKEA